MRRSHVRLRTAAREANLTPLIDMAFILVIFFVVTSSFEKEAGIPIERPGAESAERSEQGNILVAISPDGEIWVDRRQVDIRALRGVVLRLHAENPKGGVIVMADAASRTGILVEVLDQVRLAGVSNVAVAAAPPGERRR